MSQVRKLNQKGIEVFQIYINELNKGKQESPLFPILYDKTYSTPLDPIVEIENIKFESRLDAAKYFSKIFSNLNSQQVSIDVGLWSWLSLYYFDQVCPIDKLGMRYPGRGYRHILEPGYRFGHRHLLGGAYLVYGTYELGDELSKLLLTTPINRESAFHHELTSRMNFITNKSILEAASALYLEPKNNLPKKGSTNWKTPGNLRRFIDVLQQFELTYDLFSLTGKQILKLLPPEFIKWIV